MVNASAVSVERLPTGDGQVRLVYSYPAGFPARDYWLCHEARLLQEFHNQALDIARFRALDLDRGTLAVEVRGYALSQLLGTTAGSLQHPFQQSSDLIRLLSGILRALGAIHRRGMVHGGLGPDDIFLAIGSDGRIDFDSVQIAGFTWGHSPRHPLEKPVLMDTRLEPEQFLPALKEAIDRDWRHFAEVADEPGRGHWEELSPTAQALYSETLIANARINHIDWRADLYSLGYWFQKISLRRIDYHSPRHQEALPRLIKRMQASNWPAAYSSLEAVLRDLAGLELDPSSPVITGNPAYTALGVLTPMAAQAAAEADAQSIQARRENRGHGRLLRRALLTLGTLSVLAGAGWMFLAPPKHADESQPRPGPLPKPGPTPSSIAIAKPQSVEEKAEAGDTNAQVTLGLAYRHGQGKPQDYAKAVKWFRQAATQGNPEAAAYLGFLTMKGLGTAKDDTEAFKWHLQAAEAGNKNGQYNLGLSYLYGRGTKVDLVAAYKWLKLSGDPAATARLADIRGKLPDASILEAERQIDAWKPMPTGTN